MIFKTFKNKTERLRRQWETEKEYLELKEEIKAHKNKLCKNRKELTTSKILMWFLFISCSAIEVISLWATVFLVLEGMPDFGPITALISALVAEVVGLAAYLIKSRKENTAGGINYLKEEGNLGLLDNECENSQG